MHPIVRQQLPQIIEICKRHHVKRLVLFGSALDDSFDPARSDVDLLIDFERMEPEEHAESYWDLIVELEAALSRPVDVVKRHMVRNPYLERSIDRHHAVVYDAA